MSVYFWIEWFVSAHWFFSGKNDLMNSNVHIGISYDDEEEGEKRAWKGKGVTSCRGCDTPENFNIHFISFNVVFHLKRRAFKNGL